MLLMIKGLFATLPFTNNPLALTRNFRDKV